MKMINNWAMTLTIFILQEDKKVNFRTTHYPFCYKNDT